MENDKRCLMSMLSSVTPGVTTKICLTYLETNSNFLSGNYVEIACFFKVTMHLQIDNFLEIWIFESKYWSKCDL